MTPQRTNVWKLGLGIGSYNCFFQIIRLKCINRFSKVTSKFEACNSFLPRPALALGSRSRALPCGEKLGPLIHLRFTTQVRSQPEQVLHNLMIIIVGMPKSKVDQIATTSGCAINVPHSWSNSSKAPHCRKTSS